MSRVRVLQGPICGAHAAQRVAPGTLATSLRSPPPGVGRGRASPPLRADQSPCRPGLQPRQ
eukprot:3174011-Alexandrium_andersonii.AAC.1